MRRPIFGLGDDPAVSFFPLCFSLFAFHLGLCLNFPGWLSSDNDHREYTNKIGSADMAVPHLTVALFPWVIHTLCPVDVLEAGSFVTSGGIFRHPELVFGEVLVAFGRGDGLWWCRRVLAERLVLIPQLKVPPSSAIKKFLRRLLTCL